MTATATLVAPPSLDDPVETPRRAVRRWPGPGVIGAVAVMALTLVTRLIAIRTAFDLNDDEVYYTDLGKSLRQGTFPPRFDHAPFLLHPPLFFALSAAWEDILRPGPTYLDLILRTRELNVGCAAVSAGLIFYLGWRLAGRGAGLAAGLLFCFDPFLQQINGRALLETSTWMFGLAGWCILINLFRRTVRHPRALALVGGVVAGLSIVDKDIAFAVVVPPLLVAIWRRWADRKILWLATGAALVPTAIYALALGVSGSLGLWVSQETFGLQRFLGLRKITGFSQGGHPSLINTLIRQIDLYGLSYLICALGLLAALYLLRRDERADVRLLACIAIAGALTLVYATLFGTIETQMFYFAAAPSLLSLCVAGRIVARSVSPPRATIVRGVLIGLLTLVLAGEAGVWLDLRTTPDDGMARVVSWFQTHAPRPGVIANDTDVTQLVLQRYGYTSVDAGTPAQARAAHVRYLTILSVSVKGNYGTLKPAQAAWYEAHGTLVYRFDERSYGQVSIYRPDNRELW